MIIGHGGMGVVWLARDELLSRDVAVKEILWPPHFTEQEQRAACRRASTEAQVAARLNHRSVIRVFDSVEEDGYPWIVMELLPFRSLRDLVEEEGPLTPAQAARVGLGILAALRAAHAEGIVHRDVKPANILVGPDRVVLTDFGIACAADSPAPASGNGLMGSPSYIAPERATGKQSGPPSDLWGLGASLYAAVEGHPPFDRGAAEASLRAVVTEEPEPPANAGALWPVISALLRKDPNERLAAAETERLLRDVASAPAIPAAAEPAGLIPGMALPSASQPSGSRRSRAPLAALAGAAALAVLAVSGTVAGLALTSSPAHQTVASAPIAHSPALNAHGPAAIIQPPPSTHPAAPSTHPAAPSSPATPTEPHLTSQTTPTDVPVADHRAQLSDHHRAAHHRKHHWGRHHHPADLQGGGLGRNPGAGAGAPTATPPGNSQSGNSQPGNSQSGNSQSGNSQSGNSQSGNSQSGNSQSGNSQSGNSPSGGQSL
jgi:eukaryotic-like serine/threonine-protein kinase